MIRKEQMGSRKDQSSGKGGLAKTLTLDILRQKTRAAGLLANDAKSCYDRVIHAFAMFAMHRMGVAYSVLLCMFLTLQLAIHFVKTGWGVSKTSYGGHLSIQTRELPLQGLGQGNGAGPAIWAVISTVLIECMVSYGLCAQFTTALSGTLVVFAGIAFVDDTDIFYTARDNSASGEDILPQIQETLNLWEGLLRATGGALRPNKSFWYLLDWLWDGKKWVP